METNHFNIKLAADGMLVLEFVGSSSCDCRMAGSFVCEASSSVFFSEGVPSGMSVEEDAKEVCFGS